MTDVTTDRPNTQHSGVDRAGRFAPLLVPTPTGPCQTGTPLDLTATLDIVPSETEAALAMSVEMTGRRIKSILLVEDEEEFSDMMRIFLEGIPFKIEQARNGAEAIKRLLVHDFDYILCDMVMPEFPGEMFYRAVNRTKPHLCQRFIFMTGYRNDEQIHRFIKTVDGLILWKPFKFGELLEAMRLIDGRKTGAKAKPPGR